MQQDFYATVAQASLTLLGLWWVIMQIRYDEWMSHPVTRRVSLDISLYFLLPGMMSLASLLAAETPVVWRVAFAIAGALGAAEAMLSLTSTRRHGGMLALMRLGDVLSVLLYGLIAAVAVRTQIESGPLLGLTPLQTEGILVALLLSLGVSLAALMLVSAGTRPR